MPNARAALAELIGTFALTFIGAAAIILTPDDNPAKLLIVAAAHGLILATMVSATLHISGGQLNPAVSLALALTGVQPWTRAAMFIVAQLAGAIGAALILKISLSGVDWINLGNVGATLGRFSSGDDASVMAVIILEIIATFFLMFVILGTAVDPRGVGRSAAVGGFGIGLTIAADILAVGPLTGASMNPARSFGPALVAPAWDMHWVYWAAPIIGASLAAVTYRATFGLREPAPAPVHVS